MSASSIQADAIIGVMIDAHPETIPVFIRRRMNCAGCVMAPFMTIAEAASNYGVDIDEFIADLRGVATTVAERSA